MIGSSSSFVLLPTHLGPRVMTRSFLGLLCFASLVTTGIADEPQADFFEKKIRPVLVEHCYKCHAADSKSLKGNLRLDTLEGTRTGGDSGPTVVPGKPDDSLLLSALKYDDFEMPPSGKLPQSVIDDFEKWIRDGAHDPRTSKHVSGKDGIDIAEGRNFWAFQPPTTATSIDSKVTGSDRIDQLTQRRLSEAGLQPYPSVDRRSLMRRISFDLIASPPSAEDIEIFITDESATAITDVVDRLLASPEYGKRWARPWLDLARFAEDQAHIVGNNKSLFYPNAYLYRDWIINALNDDMPYDTFVRLQLAADLIEPKNEKNLAALGFIGLGPKYYRRGDPEVMAEEWEDRVDVVSRGLQGLTVACARCHDHKYDPIATEDYYALAGVFASTSMQNRPLARLKAKPKKVDGKKKKKNTKPAPTETAHVIGEAKPRDLQVMIRGKVDNLGAKVPRGFLQVLFPGDRRAFSKGSGRRELADSIVDQDNPLTARVIVNRIWKQYFGRGLVDTPSNFGQLGERPTHPELLDDLAVRFMENGWSLKWLHRQIVLSKTYQRSSELSDSSASDPANKLLWRVPRRKLSVEAWRDAVLSVAGTLDLTADGTSMQPDDPKQTKRTVYSSVSRFDLNPLLARFDFPDPNVHAATRSETDTPLQKLFLLNSRFVMAQAEHFAKRIGSTSQDASEQVRMLYSIAFQRQPSADEHKEMLDAMTESDASLQQMAQTMLISNEFWYLD